MNSPIAVRHSLGSYAVSFISMKELSGAIPSDSFVVTDDNVLRGWKSALQRFEKVLALPPGEQTKSIEFLERIAGWLLESGADRECTIAAIGGGVIGDLAGFAAATFMRGVRFVQVPTTLLAQVDSSVGGKVGIDLPKGKNMLGAFHPPQAVFVPLDALSTLPERHFRNGLAEVWKYGFIMDTGLIDELIRSPISPQTTKLDSVVARCIDLKRKVVEEDELDRSGRRAILNFGHTVGHALEQATGYGPLLHGEAISIGMVAEALIGERIGKTEPGTASSVRQCLESSGLPVQHELLREPATLISAMKRDKKALGGELAMSLLGRVGECKLVFGIPHEAVEAVLRSI